MEGEGYRDIVHKMSLLSDKKAITHLSIINLIEIDWYFEDWIPKLAQELVYFVNLEFFELSFKHRLFDKECYSSLIKTINNLTRLKSMKIILPSRLKGK